MAYLRTKHRGNRAYYYLVKGIRNNGKVRQKVLKYYGAKAPSHKELAVDILELGTTKAFDINTRITKASLKAIIGTVWRNKYTHDFAKITVIHKNPNRDDFEVYDGMEAEEIDPGLRCPLAWVRYGEKWSRAMEHWYQVDHLARSQKLEGYRKRVGYCKEQVTISRKAFHDMKTMPQAVRGGCHTANTRMRKDEWEAAKQDLDEAVRLLGEFIGGGHNKVAISG